MLSDTVHVAVAVICDADNNILIAKRAKHLHQGGLWEFPGGKVEPEETAYAALCREIKEEVDLTVKEAKPFLEVLHHYGDKHVCLDIWRVDKFLGEAKGVEGQQIKWVSLACLKSYDFPAANHAIVEKLCQ